MNVALWIYLALALAMITLLVIYKRSAQAFKCMLFTAVSGLGLLAVLWGISGITSVQMAFTPFTVAVSGILGIPGVISLLILQIL